MDKTLYAYASVESNIDTEEEDESLEAHENLEEITYEEVQKAIKQLKKKSCCI